MSRIATVLFVLACVAFESHAIALSKHKGPKEMMDKMGKAIHDAVTSDKHKEEEKKQEENKEPRKPSKILENPIDVMRGEMCWSRSDLASHDDCMGWMVSECETHTFGTGLCKRLRKYVKEECIDNKHQKACEWAKKMGIDVSVDSDGDGVPDKDDAFPNDGHESKDTDGDGIGDNADECPEDPKYNKKPCGETTTTAPAPAKEEPAAATAPAKEEPKKKEAVKEEPKKEEPKKEEPKKKEAKKEEPAPFQEPSAKDGLAGQGFSGKPVKHVDGETATADWGNEYGNHKHDPAPSSASSWSMRAVIATALASVCMAQ